VKTRVFTYSEWGLELTLPETISSARSGIRAGDPKAPGEVIAAAGLLPEKSGRYTGPAHNRWEISAGGLL
jgi:hypothetical protein